MLDSSKAIAAGVKYESDVWDFFCGKEKINAALPIFSIMTLAATGSEMNNGAVVFCLSLGHDGLHLWTTLRATHIARNIQIPSNNEYTGYYIPVQDIRIPPPSFFRRSQNADVFRNGIAPRVRRTRKWGRGPLFEPPNDRFLRRGKNILCDRVSAASIIH